MGSDPSATDADGRSAWFAADTGLDRRDALRLLGSLALVGSAGCLEARELPVVGEDDTAGEGGAAGPNGSTGAGDGVGGDDPAAAPQDDAVAALEAAIHERVVDERTERDREPLAFDAEIAAVARAHSRDMAERDYVGHASPEGERPSDRLDEHFPSPCRGIGENVAAVGRRGGRSDALDDGGETGGGEGGTDAADLDADAADLDVDAVAERIVDGWMDSPGHRENLLRERFDAHGVGVALSERRVLATQNFCDTGRL